MPFRSHIMAFGNAPMAAASITGGGTTGLVAVGSTAADALQLSTSWNTITTSSASTGVKLPPTEDGMFMGIRNDSGQTITVYPYSTATTVNAAAASVTLATAKTMFIFATSATTVATLTGA